MQDEIDRPSLVNPNPIHKPVAYGGRVNLLKASPEPPYSVSVNPTPLKPRGFSGSAHATNEAMQIGSPVLNRRLGGQKSNNLLSAGREGA